MSKRQITALEVEKKEFSTSLRGYNPNEVSAYLELVAEEIHAAARENRELRERLADVEAERDRLREQEQAVIETLKMARDMSEDAKVSARKEAELLLRQAEGERLRIVAEIERLRAEKDAFAAQLRSFLDAFYEKLPASPRGAVAETERERKSG